MTAGGSIERDGRSTTARDTAGGRRHGRLRLWLLGIAVVLAAGAGITYHVLTDPGRVRVFAERYLQQFFTTRVRVGEARFSILEGIHLGQVTVADPEADLWHRPALRFDRVKLSVDPLWLLAGRTVIEEVAIDQASCRAVFDDATSRFNLQDLPISREGGSSSHPRMLPKVRVSDARVTLVRRTPNGMRRVEDLSVDLLAQPDPSHAGDFLVSWSGGASGRSSGRCRMKWDEMTVTELKGDVPWLSIEAAMIGIEAADPTAKQWVDLLGISGRFRVSSFHRSVGDDGVDRGILDLEFTDAHLSPAANEIEQTLPPEERYFRLSSASGHLVVSRESAQLDLQGRLRGASCRVQAGLTGQVDADSTLADVGLDVAVALQGFELPRNDPEDAPAEARLINSWHRLRKFYTDYDPHGLVDARVELFKRAGADEPVRLRSMSLEARGTDASTRHFPYRVQGLTGVVEIRPDGVDIIGLTGTHNGGTVVVDGWMDAPKKQCAVSLSIHGRAIALDDDLCAGLKDRYRGIWESFSPAGTADLDVVLTRPRGTMTEPAPWNTTITAELRDAEAMFAGFAYPVTSLNGEVRIEDERVSVTRLQGRASGGQVDIAATGRIGKKGQHALSVDIEAKDVPLNDTLLAALDANARQQMEAFSPVGRVNLSCRVDSVPGVQQLSYDIDARLDDVAVCWSGFPVRVDSITGRLRLRPDRVDVLEVVGRRGDAVLRASGTIIPSASATPQPLAVHGENVVFNEELRQALPQKAQAALDGWDLAGVFDFDSTIAASAPEGDGGVTTTARIRNVIARHRSFPWPVAFTGGAIRIAGDRATLSSLRGRHGDSPVELDASIMKRGDESQVDLSLKAAQVSFDNELREALPWRFRRRWNNITPAGRFDLDLRHLKYQRHGAADEGHWEVAGSATFADAAFELGVALRQVNGTLDLSGSGDGLLSDVSVGGTLELPQVQINNHAFKDLQATVVRDGPADRWLFTDVEAGLHGGNLTAEISTAPSGRETHYEIEGAVQRMGLAGFVNAQRLNGGNAPQVNVEGNADVRFFLSGIAGDRSSQRGGGRVAVQEAQLYRLPLLLSILHVVNLAVPQESAFQQAEGDFYIVGDELRMENVLLKGQAIAMIGDGVMQLSNRQMDLDLIVVSPQRWAKVPVITELLEGAARELVEVEVSGTPQAPEVLARPLRGVEGAVQTLLVPRRIRAEAAGQGKR